MSFETRAAGPDDRLDVRRVLDAAMLDVREDLRERIAAGDVLLASEARSASERRAVEPRSNESGDTVLGALVLLPRESSAYIDAIAVRRARRGQGIGSALVRAAAERHVGLTAEFDPGVRPFYESLGFDVFPAGEDRLRGVLETES